MGKPVFVSKSVLLGVFAKYAVQQSPYHRPNNLEKVLDRLNENLDDLFKDEPLGVREFKNWQELESHLAVATELIPEFQQWNNRKNGNEEPSLAFISRYDTPGDPDDDFIDLEALWRNVANEIEREQI
jgi:hypothetical protein